MFDATMFKRVKITNEKFLDDLLEMGPEKFIVWAQFLGYTTWQVQCMLVDVASADTYRRLDPADDPWGVDISDHPWIAYMSTPEDADALSVTVGRARSQPRPSEAQLRQRAIEAGYTRAFVEAPISEQVGGSPRLIQWIGPETPHFMW